MNRPSLFRWKSSSTRESRGDWTRIGKPILSIGGPPTRASVHRHPGHFVPYEALYPTSRGADPHGHPSRKDPHRARDPLRMPLMGGQLSPLPLRTCWYGPSRKDNLDGVFRPRHSMRLIGRAQPWGFGSQTPWAFCPVRGPLPYPPTTRSSRSSV